MSSVSRAQIRAAIDAKTKPVGALGRLEWLAETIAVQQQTLSPVTSRCLLTIFAGDHGITQSGVSAYPQIVTRQMVDNFLAGGAAANVIAKSVGADLHVVDAGIAGPRIQHSNLIDRHIAAGTANSLEQPAMTTEQCETALRSGAGLANDAPHDTLCFGEMGIGNTSSASLIAAKITGCDVADLVGRGTGIDDAQLAQKTNVLRKAAARTGPILKAGIALADYGGFEIAMMCGAMMRAAQNAKLVLVDGFIASTAALCAVHIDPSCRGSLVFAHRSAEQGHSFVLEHLKARPLLDLEMRLGEGTGALLAWPLVQAAGAMLRDMASFDSAGVAGKS